jgi:hypothetical protein
MFRKSVLCAGVVVGFTLCFLAVREFVAEEDAFPMLFTLSIVLITSVCEVLPRHRQRRLTSRFERAFTLL